MGLIRTGKRADVLEQLRDIASGCLGSDRLKQEAVEAAVAIRKGAAQVQVGRTSYRVRE